MDPGRNSEKAGGNQAYLSMLESGRRSMPCDLARLAVETLHAAPTALPLRAHGFEAPVGSEELSLQLTALGYPGFAHLRAQAPADLRSRSLRPGAIKART